MRVDTRRHIVLVVLGQHFGCDQLALRIQSALRHRAFAFDKQIGQHTAIHHGQGVFAIDQGKAHFQRLPVAALAEQNGDQWGSARWVNDRAINTEFYLHREADADRAALQWLIDDGMCKSIEVQAFDAGREVMGVRIRLDDLTYEIEVV